MSTIGCIGWGSLIWDHRELPVSGEWRDDGPMLPVEFARQSMDDRLTLVLVPGVTPVRTFWNTLSVSTVDDAREALRQREGVAAADAVRDIGVWSKEQSHDGAHTVIGEWARALNLDAVVWTALAPRFDGTLGRIPTEEEAVAYLLRLRGVHPTAERYIRMTPRQVDTAYRRRFESELGWTCMPEAR